MNYIVAMYKKHTLQLKFSENVYIQLKFYCKIKKKSSFKLNTQKTPLY